jgi:predicted house-cleaning noncanonical NTP pyrophosphatase (MazG superfamily)
MSRIFHLNKLVRDGIVPSMEKHGQKVTHKVLSEEERVSALSDKLVEEAREGDLADLYAVLKERAKAEGKTIEDIAQEAHAKEEKIGGFSLGIYVETIELDDQDEWVDYYAAEPDRFPEG